MASQNFSVLQHFTFLRVRVILALITGIGIIVLCATNIRPHLLNKPIKVNEVTGASEEVSPPEARPRSPVAVKPTSTLPTRPDWTLSKAPSFCPGLRKNPVPGNRCQVSRETLACPNGTVTMPSQFSQDYYLYTRHFSKLKRRGVYIDVAANDPVRISNTYFMDACMGWDGVCVEANPKYHDDIRHYRSCKLVPTCVSERDGEKVKFILNGGAGGIEETNKHVSKWNALGKELESVELECVRMGSALAESTVEHIDYMSLDVEGHEMKVLQGFDWDKIRINVMTIEVSKSTQHEIEDFLKARGYVRHYVDLDSERPGLLHIDLVYLHKDVEFGNPV